MNSSLESTLDRASIAVTKEYLNVKTSLVRAAAEIKIRSAAAGAISQLQRLPLGENAHKRIRAFQAANGKDLTDARKKEAALKIKRVTLNFFRKRALEGSAASRVAMVGAWAAHKISKDVRLADLGSKISDLANCTAVAASSVSAAAKAAKNTFAKVRMPSLDLPSLKTLLPYKITLPDLDLPRLDISLPDISLPDISVPEIPGLKAAGVAAKKLAVKGIEKAGDAIVDVAAGAVGDALKRAVGAPIEKAFEEAMTAAEDPLTTLVGEDSVECLAAVRTLADIHTAPVRQRIDRTAQSVTNVVSKGLHFAWQKGVKKLLAPK